MRAFIAVLVLVTTAGCAPSSARPAASWPPPDCSADRPPTLPSDTIDWYGRPTCRAVFIGDTALRLRSPLPLPNDSDLWDRLSDSAYSLRDPQRFGAGYLHVYLSRAGLIRAIHYEIIPREWPPVRIAIRRACTPMTLCQIMNSADTSLVVKYVGDSLVQYDAWTHSTRWWPTVLGTERGVLVDRTDRSLRAPHN